MLGKDDYNKVLEFISKMNCYLNNINEMPIFQILNQNINFRKHILKLLYEIFDFQHLSFFIVNEQGYFSHPIGSVNDNLNHFLKLYDQYYYKYDIFNFENLPEDFTFKKVIKVDEVSSYNIYSYYRYLGLHRLCGYNSILTIPLRSNNNLIGGIAVYKTRNTPSFSYKEVELLQTLNEHISNGLNTYLNISKSLYKQNILKNYTDNLSTGLVILDDKWPITFFNNEAEDICYELLENNIEIQSKNPHSLNHYFIQEVMNYLFSTNITKEILEDSCVQKNIDVYSFIFSSFIVIKFNGDLETNYSVNITRNSDYNNKIKNSSSFYNLTKRELEIINLITQGYTNNEISEKLFISFHTVRTHVSNIFQKLDVSTRSAIAHKINNVS